MLKSIQIAYNKSFAEECRYAAEAGFRCIAVNYTEILGKSEKEWGRITEEIGNVLEKNSLSCVQTHPHYYNPFQSSEIIEEDLEFAMRQSIISSGALGAPYCVFHPRTSVSSGYRSTRSLEDNKRWFGDLLSCAIANGTGIAAENLPIFPSATPIRPLFSSDPDDLIALVDYFGSDHMGVCWDFGHANLIEGDQDSMVEALGDRIKCTHVHNNFGKRDDHAPPIYGNIRWDLVMPALAKTGYDGPLTLETHCWYENGELLRSFYRHNCESLDYLMMLAKEEVK